MFLRKNKIWISTLTITGLGVLSIWILTLAIFQRCHFLYSKREVGSEIMFDGKCERFDEYSIVSFCVYRQTDNSGFFLFNNDTMKIGKFSIANISLSYLLDTRTIANKEYIIRTRVSFDSLLRYPMIVSFRNKSNTKKNYG